MSAAEEYLTRKQVSERSGFSEQTLANWASRGEGPKCIRLGRVGGRVRYPRDDYFAWEREYFAAQS